MRVAVIPARGGSKGIPRKNMVDLGGHPLVEWSIVAAKTSGLFDKIILSSDDSDILSVGEKHGIDALLRPESLATDTAPTDALVAHLVSGMAMSDSVVLLQPTSPFRSPGLIRDVASELSLYESVMTVSRLHFVWWSWAENGRLMTNSENVKNRPRRQDMDKSEIMYSESGSVYAFRVGLVVSTGSRISGDNAGMVCHAHKFEAIDIDTVDDLKMARAIADSGLFTFDKLWGF